jgi:hypothetical protein
MPVLRSQKVCGGTGNLAMQPGLYSDYSASIVRNAPDDERELAMVALRAQSVEL